MYSILIIDSDKDYTEVIRDNLKKEGYKVYYSDRAKSGFFKAVEKKPNLVLMELALSDGDGFELLRELKSNANLFNTHIMVLSNKSDDFDIVLALELGADDFVRKPASYREISARIKSQFRYPRDIQVERDFLQDNSYE